MIRVVIDPGVYGAGPRSRNVRARRSALLFGYRLLVLTVEGIIDAGRQLAAAAAAVPAQIFPVDVIVMRGDLVRRRREVPGSLAYTAMREGRLVAES